MSPLLLKIPFGPTLWTNAAFISFHFSCLSLVFFLIFSCCVSTWLLRNLFIQSILLAPSFPRIKSSNISAICPFIVSGAYFISSSGISSHSGFSFGFILAITFRISSPVKGVVICVGVVALIGYLFLKKIFLRYSATISFYSFGLAVRPSFPSINSFLWRF